MEVTKPFECTGSGAMDAPPHRSGARAVLEDIACTGKVEIIGVRDVTKPYKFVGLRARDVTKPYTNLRLVTHFKF